MMDNMQNEQATTPESSDNVSAEIDAIVRLWPQVRNHAGVLVGYSPTVEDIRVLRGRVRQIIGHTRRRLVIQRDVLECCECEPPAVCNVVYFSHRAPVCQHHAELAVAEDPTAPLSYFPMQERTTSFIPTEGENND